MKLYTEIELRKHLYNHDERFFEELTPIELPSDEEVIKGHDAKEFQFISFWAGAAWYRNQILNQNK